MENQWTVSDVDLYFIRKKVLFLRLDQFLSNYKG